MLPTAISVQIVVHAPAYIHAVLPEKVVVGAMLMPPSQILTSPDALKIRVMGHLLLYSMRTSLAT
eukprot:4831778-Prorocentrum_lima.AAC.1